MIITIAAEAAAPPASVQTAIGDLAPNTRLEMKWSDDEAGDEEFYWYATSVVGISEVTSEITVRWDETADYNACEEDYPVTYFMQDNARLACAS